MALEGFEGQHRAVVQVPPPPPPSVAAAVSAVAAPAAKVWKTATEVVSSAKSPFRDSFVPLVAELAPKVGAMLPFKVSDVSGVLSDWVAATVKAPARGNGPRGLVGTVEGIAALAGPAMQPVTEGLQSWWRSNGRTVTRKVEDGVEVLVDVAALGLRTWTQPSHKISAEAAAALSPGRPAPRPAAPAAAPAPQAEAAVEAPAAVEAAVVEDPAASAPADDSVEPAAPEPPAADEPAAPAAVAPTAAEPHGLLERVKSWFGVR